MRKNIIFIGFMGCGKSTIAKALAKRLNTEFIDTDKVIQKKLGKKITSIFAEFGEEFFRNEEKKLAEELSQLKGQIIATGGGFYKALRKDKKSVIIYLKASFDFLEQRLGKKGLEKRPLFADKAKARTLFKQRREEYKKKADIIINIERKGVKRIVEEIAKEIQ